MHLLIKANYKDKKWQGITIKRGQLVTSSDNLASELKLSRQNIRTALKNLAKTEEVELKSTNSYTLVTISKYDSYQSSEMYDNQQLTNDQPTANQQLTTTKEVNNIISEENILLIGDAKEVCLKDEVWVAAIKGNMVLNDARFSDLVEQFTAHITMSGTTSITPSEYKKYFLNWYKKTTGKGFKGRSIVKQPKQYL